MRLADFRIVTPNCELRTLNAKGFTLIETIITLVVLSIAAIGVLSVFTTGMKGSAQPLVIDQAVQLAQEKMEETLALRQSGGFNAVLPDAGGPFPAPYDAFTWTRTVVCVTALDLNNSTGAVLPCASGYARVTVTVTHALIGNVALDTLVTNY